MRKLLTISLLFACIVAKGAILPELKKEHGPVKDYTVVINQGIVPGTNGQTEWFMGMHEGRMDYWYLTTIHVSAGTYAGFTPAKTNTTYVADGIATYTSTITFGGTFNVKFDGSKVAGVKYGFRYSGTGTIFDHGGGDNEYDTLLNWDFGSTFGRVFDGAPNSPFVVYDGTAGSTVWWGLFVDTFKKVGPGSLFFGTYETDTTLRDVNAGLTFNNGDIQFTTAGVTTQIFNQSIYAVSINNWVCTGPSGTGVDAGMVFITGNVRGNNIKRTGPSFGYQYRLIIAKLAGLPFYQESYLRNSIDIGTIRYGMVDIRTQSNFLTNTAPWTIVGGSFHFSRNTAGDKDDDVGGYVTNAVIAGGMEELSGFKDTIYIDSNLAYNAFVSPTGGDGGSSLWKNNGGGQNVIIMRNNSDLAPGVPLPAGLLDANYWPITGTYLKTYSIGAYGPSSVGVINTKPFKRKVR